MGEGEQEGFTSEGERGRHAHPVRAEAGCQSKGAARCAAKAVYTHNVITWAPHPPPHPSTTTNMPHLLLLLLLRLQHHHHWRLLLLLAAPQPFRSPPCVTPLQSPAPAPRQVPAALPDPVCVCVCCIPPSSQVLCGVRCGEGGGRVQPWWVRVAPRPGWHTHAHTPLLARCPLAVCLPGCQGQHSTAQPTHSPHTATQKQKEGTRTLAYASALALTSSSSTVRSCRFARSCDSYTGGRRMNVSSP